MTASALFFLPAGHSDEAESSTEHYSVARTEIAVLMDDPSARAVLEGHVPGIAIAAGQPAVRYAPLKALQSFAPDVFSDAMLADVDNELKQLTPRPRDANDISPWRPINVDEDAVGAYTLPDPLILANGKTVRSVHDWWSKRRPEIYRLFETEQFGRAPARPKDEYFEVVDRGARALQGKALRRQVVIHLSHDPMAPTIQLVEYLPKVASKPVPLLLIEAFTSSYGLFDDPDIRPGMVWNPQIRGKVASPKPTPRTRVPVEALLNAGFGIAAFYYGDVEPDFPEGYDFGIRSFYARGRPLPADAWGSIAAWAWGMSRVQDYLQTDPAVDARRVAVFGASRLGKAALWAAASDRRFAAATVCCSGEGGAALSHRNFGQTIAELLAEQPHQFADNYHRYADKEDSLPMDAHMLLALIAPRPVFLQTGRYDYWSDPKGEFMAEVAAGPVYRLLGKKDLGTTTWPPADPILNDLGYFVDDGGHDIKPDDWRVYLAFLRQHLHP